MLQSTKIQGKTSFIGANDDIILNSAPGEWDFGGATITNVIVNTAGGFNAMEQTLFVEPNFTEAGVFYNTIQGAIDKAISDNTPYTILVFPGTYDEKITIDNANNIRIIGLGNVYLQFHGAESTETILIDTSENISLENLIIIDDTNLINTLSNVLLVKITNCNNCKIKNVRSDLNLDGITDFVFSKLLALSGNIFFEGVEWYVYIRTGTQTADSYIKFIDYDGNGSEGKIRTNGSKFRFEILKTDSSYHTFVNFLKLLTDTQTNYEFVLHNCELEYQEANGSVEGLNIDALEAKRLPGTTDKYDKIGFFNSFINCDYNIDVMSQNVIKDSDFKILN